MDKVDVTVIGAGVVGLAVAEQIAGPSLSVLVLEKNARHGEGISSRNSEIIHAGIYYPPGSLKASLCVAGREMLYDIASKNGIPHKKIGKLIVATEPSELEYLENLERNGRQNGVSSLNLITGRQARQLEPNIEALAALYSPETGIVSAHDLMYYFLTRALEKKVTMAFRTRVEHVEKENNGWRMITKNEKGEAFAVMSSVVVNAAGLESDAVAAMMGADYRLHYCKGDYCSISGVKRGTVQRLVYPVPDRNHVGLGVHLTIDLNGGLKLGPDAAYMPRTEDYRVDGGKAPMFYRSAKKFLPFLKEQNVMPDMAGIRPKLQGPEDEFRDFVIQRDAPGFINLVGIESPGLTASPAIARYVKKILR